MRRAMYGVLGALALLGADAPRSMYEPPSIERAEYPNVDPDASYCYSSLVTASFASLQDRSSWGREYSVSDVPLGIRAQIRTILDENADESISEREACDAMSAVADVAMREKQGFRALDVLRAYGDAR